MKYDVINRWSGRVQFTADIDCPEDATTSVKLGLAVKWGVRNGARLTDADLTRADLTRADLTRANLTRANLTRANLTRANLTRANLTRADLTGVIGGPICLAGLAWHVTITQTHIGIGCEWHTTSEWAAFDNARIARMDGCASRRFWDKHRDMILALAAHHQRAGEADTEVA